MQEEEKIETIFEFVTKGSKETEASMDFLLSTQLKLQKVIKETEVIYSQQGKEMDKLTTKYKDLSKEIDSGNKKSRADFIKTKDAIKEVGASMDGTKKSIDEANATYSKLSGGIGTVNATMKDLKETQKVFTKELENVKIGSEEYQKLGAQLGAVKKTIKEVNDANKELGKSSSLVVGSVEELRKKYSDLSKEWKKTKIDSPEFAEKTKQLNAYNEELKKVEASVGVYSRSVGDYKLAAQGFNDQLKAMAPALTSTIDPLKGVVGGFKAISVTPVVGVLTVLVGLFDYLRNSLSKTSEGQEQLNVAMAGFNGIVEFTIEKVVDLAKWLVKIFTDPAEAWEDFEENIIGGMIKSLTNIANLAQGAAYALAGMFSEDAKKKSEEYFEAARQGFKEQAKFIEEAQNKIKEGIELGKLENKIKQNNLKESILIAENERESIKLRSEADKKEEYTFRTRIVFLQKSLELSQENAKIKIDSAKEELELIQRRNSLGKSNFAALEKEAAAKAKIIQLETEYLESTKKVKKQLYDFEKQENDAIAKLQQDANTQYLKSLSEIQKAEEELLKATLAGDEKQIELSQKVYNIRKEIYKKSKTDRVNLTQEELLGVEIAEYDHLKKIEGMNESAKQKEISDYVKFEQDRFAIEQQIKASKDVDERKYLTEKLKETEKLVEKQITVLKKYDVEASKIPIVYAKSFNKSQESITQSLQKSLETIKTFSGDALGVFGQLTTSTSALIASAFELSNVKEKWGDDLEGMKADTDRLAAEIATLAAASASNLNQGLSKVIQDNFNQQLSASKLYYAEQSQIQKTTFDVEKRQLDEKLKAEGASEGKAAIERFKLEEKQEKQRIDLKKKEADSLYQIQTKQFRVKQAQDAISAIIGTALGIAAAWANPITAPFMVPIIASVGAASVATIYAQAPPPKPSFKKGGYLNAKGVIEGNSHDNGGVPISIGGTEIAEAEGGEGALIISKKAMNDPEARALFQAAHARNEEISGKNSGASKFEQGGYLDYAHFREIAAHEAHQKYLRDKKKYWIFAKKKSEKDIDSDAKNMYNRYREEQIALLDAQEKAAEQQINQGISSNSTLQEQGIGNVQQYNQKLESASGEKESLEKKIKAEKEYSDAKIDLLKQQLGYEEKLSEFDDRKKNVQKELSNTTLALDKKNLEELRKNNKITEEEYKQMLDQITLGYGIKTQDIINLKKKEVEETKKLITEEYNFQKQALNDIRQTWKKEYSALTKDALANLDKASEYVDKLTGTDLERYQSILKINDDIKKLNEDYQDNENTLTNGVILSREETKKLVEEQKRIKEEIKQKEKEAEEEKQKFEEERKKNESVALANYESENKDKILADIKAQAEALKLEADKWSIDKEITAQYNQQIAAQDQIISNMENEYKQAQLLHDQKVANIKTEEDALKNTFETQKKKIEDSYKSATANMNAELSSLNATILAIKQAGSQAGIDKYENTLNTIASNLNNLPKFASGGAISIGSGVFKAYGDTDKGQGKGINMAIGGVPIARIGGGENVIITNEGASKDPRMIKPLEEISAINNYYNTGIPVPTEVGEKIDYDILADKLASTLGKVISRRPVNAYFTNSELDKSQKNNQLFRRNSQMK